MAYTRGGRPLIKVKKETNGISVSDSLIVADLNMEGITGKIYSKAGKVPKGYFVYRGGKKIEITEEEYTQINEERLKK